jgi:hypothetical protein
MKRRLHSQQRSRFLKRQRAEQQDNIEKWLDLVEELKTQKAPPHIMAQALAGLERAKQPPVIRCNAFARTSGKPCRNLAELGHWRCRFHGGKSTGPKTKAGRARSLAALKEGNAQWRAKATGNPSIAEQGSTEGIVEQCDEPQL